MGTDIELRDMLLEIINGSRLEPLAPSGCFVVNIEIINRARILLGLDQVDLKQERQKTTESTKAEARRIVIDNLRQGNKLNAIRLWRELTGDLIRTSRDVVNKIQEEEAIIIERPDPSTWVKG